MPMLNPKARIVAVIGAALIAAAAFAPAANARSEMPTGGPPAEYIDFLKMKPMQAMHMIDVGKKGYVTREEYMKFHEDMFDRMDKDRDGKLTPQEWLGRQVRQSDG